MVVSGTRRFFLVRLKDNRISRVRVCRGLSFRVLWTLVCTSFS